MLEKHEPQASVSRTSRVFLKIPNCLYNSIMHEEQVFYFFYKIETQKRVPLLVLKRSNYKSIDIVLHFFLNFFLIDKTQSFFVSLTIQKFIFSSFMKWKDKIRQTCVNIDFLLTGTIFLIRTNLKWRWKRGPFCELLLKSLPIDKMSETVYETVSQVS